MTPESATNEKELKLDRLATSAAHVFALRGSAERSVGRPDNPNWAGPWTVRELVTDEYVVRYRTRAEIAVILWVRHGRQSR